MDGWGNKLLTALHTALELLAMGLGLPKDAITSLMEQGPHLLGPTGPPPLPPFRSPTRPPSFPTSLTVSPCVLERRYVSS